jgi:hypothetical protein
MVRQVSKPKQNVYGNAWSSQERCFFPLSNKIVMYGLILVLKYMEHHLTVRQKLATHTLTLALFTLIFAPHASVFSSVM